MPTIAQAVNNLTTNRVISYVQQDPARHCTDCLKSGHESEMSDSRRCPRCGHDDAQTYRPQTEVVILFDGKPRD